MCFFDSITNVSNTRNIHAQQIVVDPWVEERDINLTFHDDDDEVVLEGDERDVALQDLHKWWRNEDSYPGVAEGVNGSQDGGNRRHVGVHGGVHCWPPAMVAFDC